MDNHTLRHEPCFPHQSYVPGFPAGGIKDHDTPDRYIGDFNNANQTNLYTVRGDGTPENYTALFAGAGFRYAQLSGLPAGWSTPAGVAMTSVLTALRIHTDVAPTSAIKLPMTTGQFPALFHYSSALSSWLSHFRKRLGDRHHIRHSAGANEDPRHDRGEPVFKPLVHVSTQATYRCFCSMDPL